MFPHRSEVTLTLIENIEEMGEWGSSHFISWDTWWM